MVESSLIALIAIIFHIHVYFILGNLKRDNSIMSAGWGLGFIWIILFSYIFLELSTNRQFLLSGMIVLWGLRLFLHVSYKKFKLNIGEDFRYVEMRARWGNKEILGSYLNVYLLQGILMYIIALPIIYVIGSERDGNLGSLDYIAIVIFVIGLTFETLADLQLLRFKSKPENKEKILKDGFWKYSRHPNYFGEVVVWWGIGLIGYSISPYSLVSPLVITFLLRFVSGVPMLEKKYADNSSFTEYKSRTNAFIPWNPKSI